MAKPLRRMRRAQHKARKSAYAAPWCAALASSSACDDHCATPICAMPGVQLIRLSGHPRGAAVPSAVCRLRASTLTGQATAS
jgi:hypothetical protein